MNPKDIMTDAIHNFHPQYQQYTQYSSGKKCKFNVACMCIFFFNLLFSYCSFVINDDRFFFYFFNEFC